MFEKIELYKAISTLEFNSFRKGSIGHAFAKLIHHGKVKSAIRLLANISNSGPGALPVDQTLPVQGTMGAILKEKHSHARPANLSALLPTIEQPDLSSFSHPAIFGSLNGAAVRSSALHVEGSAGQSTLDATAWRHEYLSYGKVLDKLYCALVDFAKCICTE